MLVWKLPFSLLTCSVHRDCGSGSEEWSIFPLDFTKNLIWFHIISSFSITFIVSFQALSLTPGNRRTLHWRELEQDMKAKTEFVNCRLYRVSPSIYYFYCRISCHAEKTLCWLSKICLKLGDSICLVRKAMVLRFYHLFLCFFLIKTVWGFDFLAFLFRHPFVFFLIFLSPSMPFFFSNFFKGENIISMSLWSWL